MRAFQKDTKARLKKDVELKVNEWAGTFAVRETSTFQVKPFGISEFETNQISRQSIEIIH